MQTQKHSVSFKSVLMIGCLITTLPSYGQTEPSCVSNNLPLKQEQARHYRLYFLNRNSVPISACPPSQDTCEPQLAANYKLGELFFAAEEKQVENGDSTKGQQFLLGKYSRNMECFTELVGWIDSRYLIQGVRPIRVGEAVTRFSEIAAPANVLNETGFSPANRLDLKVLSDVGFFLFRLTPSKDAPQRQLGSLEALPIWRYVYAIEKVEGELWYLVGQSNLLTGKRLGTINQTDASLTAEAKKVLLGWIQRKTVMEWPSNLVLAYNTQPAAVAERLQTNEAWQYKPLAKIYLEPREDSEVMATESVDLWQDYRQGQARTDQTLAWPDPIGLAPNVPRLFVQGYDKETGMYRVGFFGKRSYGLLNDKPITFLPFSIGYAKRHQSQHSHETFREELVIGVRDLKRLRNVIEVFVESLDHAFEVMNSAGTKQDIIGAALLYAVAVATGDDDKTQKIEQMWPPKLKRYVKRWLNSSEVRDNTLAELIGIYDQIPTATHSILGMTVNQILSLPEDEDKKDYLVQTCPEESKARCEHLLTFAEHRELLDQKLACLKYIIHGKTVPTDVNRCRAHRGKDKTWRYSPPGSYQDFIYLPRYLIP